MLTRTNFLARLLGLYCIVVALFMFTHKAVTVEIVTGLLRSPAQLFMIGLAGFACGLAMVLSHNVWSGGVLPVAVTVVSWLSLVKSLALLFLSSTAASVFFLEVLHYAQLFYAYVSVTAILGIFLFTMSLVPRDRRISVTAEADLFSELTLLK